MPDLVCRLLPGLVAEPEQESSYIFRPVVLKKLAHHPDGLLWPGNHPGGSARRPVVRLEVQMHGDKVFHRRLGPETLIRSVCVGWIRIIQAWQSPAPGSSYYCLSCLGKAIGEALRP